MSSAELQFIASEVSRLVDESLRRVALAKTARVGTTAILGFAALRDFTSINGDVITNGEAAVWIDTETPGNANYAWCPVRRGVTLAEGDYVRVVRDHLGSDLWYVDAKL